MPWSFFKAVTFKNSNISSIIALKSNQQFKYVLKPPPGQLPHSSWSPFGAEAPESWHGRPNPDDDITTHSSVIPALAPAATVHMISIAANASFLFFPSAIQEHLKRQTLTHFLQRILELHMRLCNLNGPLLMFELQVFWQVQH